MLYQRKSFSVASRNLSSAMCDEKGHSGTDSRGNCYACGAKIAAGPTSAVRSAPARELQDPGEDIPIKADGSTDPFARVLDERVIVDLSGGPLGTVTRGLGELTQLSGSCVYSINEHATTLYYRRTGPTTFEFDGFARTP